MSKGQEQVSRDVLPVPPGKAKQFAKRALRRSNRRSAKRDPEHAPRRHCYAGWYW